MNIGKKKTRGKLWKICSGSETKIKEFGNIQNKKKRTIKHETYFLDFLFFRFWVFP